MRLVIQRVTEASLRVEGKLISQCDRGLMILVGVETGDSPDDARWLAAKVVNMRIFEGVESEVMNFSVKDIAGEIMAVSQFTLTASTRKGNRPSYIRAAKGPEAEPLYGFFCAELENLLGRKVARGIFGADMKISLINDGPVTIVIDSRLRE